MSLARPLRGRHASRVIVPGPQVLSRVHWSLVEECSRVQSVSLQPVRPGFHRQRR